LVPDQPSEASRDETECESPAAILTQIVKSQLAYGFSHLNQLSPPRTENQVPMSKQSNSRHLFVVDDEQAIASSLAMILRYQGFEVSSFTDPLKALQALQTTAPDLLITDVVMPTFSGIELAIKSRNRCPACKVLLLSGQPITAQLLEAARVEGHYFEILAKPIHPTDLLTKIRSVLGLEA
jgi:DNA-binding NtrC family response regulator